MITRELLANCIKDYLLGRSTLEELVIWAEGVMAEDEIDPGDLETVRDIVSRLGLGDTEAFGLTWEKLKDMLSRLGYHTRVEVEKVA